MSYTPTIFGGLDGQLALSQLPSSWARADALMGNGAGKILALPWHQYLEYSFTGGRVIANPAQSSFTRDVIAGDNLQVADFASNSTSPQSKYLQTLFNDGQQLKDFGALVAPLGVQYVVLAKTTDWSSYKWLTHQDDLRLVMTTKSLEVWQNMDFQGVGGRYRSLQSVSSVTRSSRSPRARTSRSRRSYCQSPQATGATAQQLQRSGQADLSPGVRCRARSHRVGRASTLLLNAAGRRDPPKFESRPRATYS